jgi:hypothetical protein
VLLALHIQFFFQRAGSANGVRDLVLGANWEWCAAGNEIATSGGTVLDAERMETRGEEYVYSVDEKIIHLEADVPLENIENAFKSNSRRTINRMKSQKYNSRSRRVDKRLLSSVFWMNTAKKIIEGGEQAKLPPII